MSETATPPGNVPEGAEASQNQYRNLRRERRGGAGLMARGEPAIWLTGGALGLALVMVVGLLGLVIKQGIGTFWPRPVLLLQTVDGQRFMGEQDREETFRFARTALESLKERRPAAHAIVAPRFTDDARHIQASRRRLRTGNFEITNEHFDWVNRFEVADDGESQPEWGLTIERRKGGRFYGELIGYVEVTPWDDLDPAAREALPADQLLLVSRAKGHAAALVEKQALQDTDDVVQVVRQLWRGEEGWAQYRQRHDASAGAMKRIHRLEKEIGEMSDYAKDVALAVTAAKLDYGEGSSEHKAAQEAKVAYEQQTKARSDELEQQIAALHEQVDFDGLLVSTTSDVDKFIPAANTVLAYPANRLSFGEKLSIYLTRWLEFLTEDPREANSEGGVFPAIVGTVVMTMIMCVAVVPFGVLAALYLREYAKAGFIVSAVRIAVNNLAGVPSIVFGVFGLGFFCYGFGKYIDGGPTYATGVETWSPGLWLTALVGLFVLCAGAIGLNYLMWSRKRSLGRGAQLWLARGVGVLWIASFALVCLLLVHTPFFEGFYKAKLVATNNPTFGKGGVLWASMTLALLTLPVVIVATEEALAAVPNSMREGSYACGASKWQTIHRIVLPRAMPGIMTGTILAMARGAGEVAPLMLVGAVKLAPKLPLDGTAPFVHPQRSFMHLGFHIFDVGFQSQNSEAAKPMVFTTTLLLISIVAALNLAAIWLRARLRRKFKGSQF